MAWSCLLWSLDSSSTSPPISVHSSLWDLLWYLLLDVFQNSFLDSLLSLISSLHALQADLIHFHGFNPDYTWMNTKYWSLAPMISPLPWSCRFINPTVSWISSPVMCHSQLEFNWINSLSPLPLPKLHFPLIPYPSGYNHYPFIPTS